MNKLLINIDITKAPFQLKWGFFIVQLKIMRTFTVRICLTACLFDPEYRTISNFQL